MSMSRQQALEKAQRLWGGSGAVYCFHDTFYEVGMRAPFHFMVAYGTGASWEAAFADAARRMVNQTTDASPYTCTQLTCKPKWHES